MSVPHRPCQTTCILHLSYSLCLAVPPNGASKFLRVLRIYNVTTSWRPLLVVYGKNVGVCLICAGVRTAMRDTKRVLTRRHDGGGGRGEEGNCGGQLRRAD